MIHLNHLYLNFKYFPGRSCIRPEVSRTKTFGKVGVSNGLFYEKHLKYIVLNTKFVPFTVLDLSFLGKERYDEGWVGEVYRTPLVSLEDLKAGRVSGKSNKAVRLAYHTREAYKRSAKALGIMEDFKSGVPRTAYRGIVSFMHSGVRVFLAPNVNWQGYDPKWAWAVLTEEISEPGRAWSLLYQRSILDSLLPATFLW